MFSCNLAATCTFGRMTWIFYMLELYRWGGTVTEIKSQHGKLTLEKKILPPLLLTTEPATFRSQVWHSTTELSPLQNYICTSASVTSCQHYQYVYFSCHYIATLSVLQLLLHHINMINICVTLQWLLHRTSTFSICVIVF